MGSLPSVARGALANVLSDQVDKLLELDLLEVFVSTWLELEFHGVQLLLRGGRVREVRLGEPEGKGSLEIAGHEVAKRVLGGLTLPGVLKLDPGIPLRA